MTLTLPDTDAQLDANESAGGTITLGITRDTPWLATAQTTSTVEFLHTEQGWAAHVAKGATAERAVLHLAAPVLLSPVFIAKPWGQEIWFSGIEERGETTVSQGQVNMSLSSYMALAPKRLMRRAAPLLLKILDPNSSASNGALYFETHNTKHEVYVITRVDEQAWPNALGAIRIGMDQAKRTEAGSDDAFRASYLQAVQAYEAVRRSIDEASGAAHPDLLQQEHRLRGQMEAFTAQVPLRVGDVVQVSPHVPHSLQHGVQAFEFQTPTYERNIISFNQQVLTQDHWDSTYAINSMSLDGPPQPKLKLLAETHDQRIETIVDFADFDVLRITLLTAGAEITSDLFEQYSGYSMIALVAGEVELTTAAGTLKLATNHNKEHADSDAPNHNRAAALIPACAISPRAIARSDTATLLLARPKPHTADTIPLSD